MASLKQENTHATSRREFLKTGGKYAALVPVSTVLVSKSARAGGSGVIPPFVNGRGETASTREECKITITKGKGRRRRCRQYFDSF
jgi:hypothetical protein